MKVHPPMNVLMSFTDRNQMYLHVVNNNINRVNL